MWKKKVWKKPSIIARYSLLQSCVLLNKLFIMFNFCIGMENTSSELVNEGKKGPKFQWTLEEDDNLVECLLELASDVKWKAGNGFKAGFIVKLEELMEKKLPECGIKASPHIESRYKILRRKYRAIWPPLHLLQDWVRGSWENNESIQWTIENRRTIYIRNNRLRLFHCRWSASILYT